MEIAIATVVVGVLGALRTLIPTFTADGRRAARLRADVRLATEIPEGPVRDDLLEQVARDLARYDQIRERRMHVRASKFWAVVPATCYLAAIGLGVITSVRDWPEDAIAGPIVGVAATGVYVLAGNITLRVWSDARTILPDA